MAHWLLRQEWSLSFVTFGMMVATVGHSIGLTESVLAQTGAMLMMVFGLVLLIPGISSGADVLLANGM